MSVSWTQESGYTSKAAAGFAANAEPFHTGPGAARLIIRRPSLQALPGFGSRGPRNFSICPVSKYSYAREIMPSRV